MMFNVLPTPNLRASSPPFLRESFKGMFLRAALKNQKGVSASPRLQGDTGAHDGEPQESHTLSPSFKFRGLLKGH